MPETDTGEHFGAAWRKVTELIAANAKHRKGFTLGKVSPDFILAQATAELEELLLSPNDPGEVADLLGVLFHYCQKQGWTASRMQTLMLSKFEERFTIPPKE